MKTKSVEKHTERGQSMIELALVITILMILLAGTIDLGRAMFVWLAMRDAAQEGAAYGSINPTDDGGINQRVLDNLDQVVPDISVITIQTSNDGDLCLGHDIQVDVYYNEFPLTMPFLGWVLNSQTIVLHATINDTILRPTCE